MAGLKANPLFDLFLFLAIISVVVFCFVELSFTWGVISLAVGIPILLLWIHLRTEIFK